MKALIVLVSLGLVGCAPLITQDETRGGMGQAGYRYEKTTSPDGTQRCVVEVASGRAVNGGDIEVGPDCTLKANAEIDGASSAALQSQTLNVLDTALQKLP